MRHGRARQDVSRCNAGGRSHSCRQPFQPTYFAEQPLLWIAVNDRDPIQRVICVNKGACFKNNSLVSLNERTRDCVYFIENRSFTSWLTGVGVDTSVYSRTIRFSRDVSLAAIQSDASLLITAVQLPRSCVMSSAPGSCPRPRGMGWCIFAVSLEWSSAT